MNPPAPPPYTGMTPVDWGIVISYATLMLLIGWYCGRRSESTTEYFVANRRMNPFLIGVSLFVTLLSTITFLSVPGEMISKGPVFLTRVAAYPIAFLIVGFVLLPVYMRQHVTSAYELLEHRMGPSVRMLGAVLFIVSRLVWMSLLIFEAARAMAVIVGVDPSWIPGIVVIMGVITVVYTSFGGVRAVVMTDLIQAILLCGGAVLVLSFVTMRLGGLSWFPTVWNDHWDHQPVFSLDPSTRITVVGTIISTALFLVTAAGADQTSVQRFMSTVDAAAARRALAVQLVIGAGVTLMLGVVGFALLGYFQAFPEHQPQEDWLRAQGDRVFPYFITFHLPPGLTGLVVSGLFAAAMSSLDSGVNSITAVVMTDFMERSGYAPRSERQHLRTARLLALAIGVLVVLGSSLMGYVPGNINAVTAKTANLLTPTIFCLFCYVLFIPSATIAGVWTGTITGTLCAVLAAFSGPIFGPAANSGADPVSFQWIALISVTTNLAAGLLVSRIGVGR